MLRGFYTAASGMITQQRQQEALANNIANANTPGYKSDQATIRAFPEMLIQQVQSQNISNVSGKNRLIKNQVGPLNTGVYIDEMIPNFNQGDLRETGIMTDIALENGLLPDATGNLFLTVQNEAGDVRYTRNGNLTVDGQGALVTNQGYYVLDHLGNPIQTNGMDFTVSPEGMVNIGGQNIQLGVAYAANAHDLVKEGNGLFAGELQEVPAGATYTVRQGFLEHSNVDELQTTTQMMEAFRMFETNQTVLKAYDESMDKAVNQIGRIG